METDWGEASYRNDVSFQVSELIPTCLGIMYLPGLYDNAYPKTPQPTRATTSLSTVEPQTPCADTVGLISFSPFFSTPAIQSRGNLCTKNITKRAYPEKGCSQIPWESPRRWTAMESLRRLHHPRGGIDCVGRGTVNNERSIRSRSGSPGTTPTNPTAGIGVSRR